MIHNPHPTQRALLTWQRPLGEAGRRDRCAVAELTQNLEGGVTFRYFNEEQLEAARLAGFTGYPGLPVESDELDRIALGVLMRRLPPLDRGDFNSFLERFGLPADRTYNPLSLLAYTGARLTSDSFSVCETFDGFDAPFTYVFDVAGNRHYQELYSQLNDGDPLLFVREPDNEFDPNAIRVTRADDETVGYINRLQADAVGQWVDGNNITAEVFRINGRTEYPRLFVRAEIEQQASSLAA